MTETPEGKKGRREERPNGADRSAWSAVLLCAVGDLRLAGDFLKAASAPGLRVVLLCRTPDEAVELGRWVVEKGGNALPFWSEKPGDGMVGRVVEDFGRLDALVLIGSAPALSAWEALSEAALPLLRKARPRGLLMAVQPDAGTVAWLNGKREAWRGLKARVDVVEIPLPDNEPEGRPDLDAAQALEKAFPRGAGTE